jgi:hypothetical protein
MGKRVYWYIWVWSSDLYLAQRNPVVGALSKENVAQEAAVTEFLNDHGVDS